MLLHNSEQVFACLPVHLHRCVDVTPNVCVCVCVCVRACVFARACIDGEVFHGKFQEYCPISGELQTKNGDYFRVKYE